MENNAVLAEMRGKVLILTINRPQNGNAIVPAVTQGFEEALADAANNPDVAAVIVTGAGEKIFCGGMDLKFLAENGVEAAQGIAGEHGFAGMTRREDFPKPLIAAVNGAAMGGGTEIALACDLIVCAEHAKFGLPEVKRGLLASAGGPIRMLRQLPRALAYELVLTGNPITAQQALQYHLVNRVVPKEQLLDEALKLAEEISCNAPLSIRYSKELLIYAQEHSLEESFVKNDEVSEIVFSSEDSVEGPRAFAEKRAPVWKGR